MSESPDELVARLTALEARVDGLNQHLHSITHAVVHRMDDAEKPAPIRWRDLSADDARAKLSTLAEWTDWLRSRYALDSKSLPFCWQRHGALVEELAALWAAWTAAFQLEGNPAGPATWHDTLARVLLRLREWAARTGCRPGEHHEDLVPEPGGPPLADPSLYSV